MPVSPNYPGIFRLLIADLRAKARWVYDQDQGIALVKVLLTDGTMAMLWYRCMQWSRRYRLAPLEMLFNKINTFINGTVQGGNNVFLEHQVTIGAERRQAPVLGNDIFVGAGAKIIGSITVGDGARIGANAVVVKDVPPHTTVVGIPAHVVRVREATETPRREASL